MNVDLILSAFNTHQADYILIGGMNFFIVHQPVTTRVDDSLPTRASRKGAKARQIADARIQSYSAVILYD